MSPPQARAGAALIATRRRPAARAIGRLPARVIDRIERSSCGTDPPPMGRFRQVLRTPDGRSMFRSRCVLAPSRWVTPRSSTRQTGRHACPARRPRRTPAARPRCADGRKRSELPAQGCPLPHLRRDDRRARQGRRGSRFDRAEVLDRQELPGPHDLGREDLRQRRDRRERARGAVRRAPPRARAPDRRAGTRRPALAQRWVHH